jgi:hypothetical protein
MKRKGKTLSRVEGNNNKGEKIIRYEVVVSTIYFTLPQRLPCSLRVNGYWRSILCVSNRYIE